MVKSKMNAKIISLFVAICMLMSCITIGKAYAAEIEAVAVKKVGSALETAMTTPDWDFVSVSNDYNTSRSGITTAEAITLTFPCTCLNSFIDFSSWGNNINLEEVSYSTSNDNVAYVIEQGGVRIYANGVGNAIITITYGSRTQNINVTVENSIDEQLPIYLDYLESVETTGNARSIESITRQDMHDKAMAMYSYDWTPTQNLVKWGNVNSTRQYFSAGVRQHGLPYTQNWKGDELQFAAKLTASDFYTPVTLYGTRVAPRYGSDCATFVACAWGFGNTTYYTVSSIVADVGSRFTALSDYSDMQKGDALYNSEHIFMITNNFTTPPSGSSYTEPYVVSIEQTPPITIYSFFTYSQLAQRGYSPISYFN